MSWVTDDGEHECSASPELRDGRRFHGWTGKMLLVELGTGGKPDVLVPYSEVIGWRGRCECGWTSDFWERVTDPAETNPLLRRIFVEDDDAGDAPSDVEDAIYAQWRRHIEPLQRVAGVRDAATKAARARAELDKAVTVARSAGASWADIGSAVGITRQSAHERWGQSA